MPRKVCLVGSGNWGSAIARIIGENVKSASNEGEFETEIAMSVYEEMIGDRKLTEIINTDHENVKYLPGYKLPENVVAYPDLLQATKDASILIFCLPHQFLSGMLPLIKKQGLPENTIAISLIKGIDFDENGIVRISNNIKKYLGIDCAVLMGANVATEVAAGDFCEATIGCNNVEDGKILKKLFNAPKFRIQVVQDPAGVEMCGALKNIVALGAGFCDGLGYGGNTKAAIIRIGLLEMKAVCFKYFEGVKDETFFESCGIADLITTCFGGRNRKCAALFAESFVKAQKGEEKQITWEDLEETVLNGQKLQGTLAAKELYEINKRHGNTEEFPLFTTIYKIAYEGLSPEAIIQ